MVDAEDELVVEVPDCAPESQTCMRSWNTRSFHTLEDVPEGKRSRVKSS
jgi:hypothetical protein